MTTEQTAQQLELAAQILRTGHPWECKFSANAFEKPVVSLITAICDKKEIRPVLATPPYPAQLHNPDNLTAEQVGVGYRLALPGESAASPHDFWDGDAWKKAKLLGPAIFAWCCRSCRLPLSVPWPEPEKPDPYAELKAAHAAGKVIQGLIGGHWINSPHPTWKYPVDTYRVKPDEPVVCAVVKPEPAFQLPPAPPGMRWHREDGWTADDLPQGYRPLVVGEKYVSGDEYRTKYSKDWHPETFLGTHTGSKEVTQSESSSLRTRRLLTFEHAGKTWTWHRPGDPMPCDGEREVVTLLEDLDIGGTIRAGRFDWGQCDDGEQIIGWRYAEPQTKTVPLGPEDVPPGSVFRSKDQPTTTFWTVSQVWEDGFYLRGDSMPWDTARERMQINRSLSKGQWNPDAWEPCSKTIPV